jgi:titin
VVWTISHYQTIYSHGGFTGNGVHLTRSAVNYIGTDVSGTAPLGNFNDGVLIDGSNNTVGGTVDGVRNLISNNGANSGSNGVELTATATNNLVAGNYIGTDVTGSASLPNGRGVYVLGDSNTIGGTTAQTRNISGNTFYGIEIQGRYNLVEGNYIGTDVNGGYALGNGLDGVLVIPGSAMFNTIGGTVDGARNVISGNSLNGVNLWPGAGNNLVLGNFIGIVATGENYLGNGLHGVLVSGPANTVGGTVAGAGNVA